MQRICARHPKACYYVLLAGAVTLAYLGINAYMIATGRETVWIQDAQPLYSNFLIWASQQIAQIGGAIASGQAPVWPQYTYYMGYGADVPMTMGSYLQDPFNLIALLMPNELIGVSYPLMVWARMVAAAMAFSWYCFAKGHGRAATGIASLAYVTCGFIIMLGAFRHPKFIDWAILLPLILQGADRLFDGKSPVLFVGALASQFIVSIYFSYMSCIVLLVYCLVKYFFAPRDRNVRDFGGLVALFAAMGVLAFMISGLFSLNQIIALLSQGRATSGGVTVPMLFTLKYYAKVAAHFLGAAGTTDGMVLGAVTSIGVLVYVLCGRRCASENRRAWLVGLALCLAGVLIPYLGHVMNGMGYSTDRWMLVFAFVCSYLLCMAYPSFEALDKREWRRVTVVFAAMVALTFVYGIAQVATADGARGMIWPLVTCAVAAVVYVVVRRVHGSVGRSAARDDVRSSVRDADLRADRGAGRETGGCENAGQMLAGEEGAGKRGQGTAHASAGNGCASWVRPLIATGASIVVCATLSATFYCSPLGENWGKTFPSVGTTWNNIAIDSPGAAAELIEDDGLYRYTLPRVHNSMKNSALVHGVMGIDYYTSFYNQYVDDFRQGLGISDHHMNFSFIGSDSRLAIEDLTGAKYYICKSRDFWRVPHGFEDTGISYRGFRVFRNANPMPLGFATTSVMSDDEYEALSMVQKQEALLQSAIVDADVLADADAYDRTPAKTASKSIAYTVAKQNGLVFENGVVHVLKTGATATLRLDGLPDAETYLSIDNLDFRPFSPSEIAKANGDKVTLKTRIRDVLWTVPTTYPITASVGDHTKTANPATPRHLRYGGKTDWVFNLCYSEKAVTSIKLEFSEVGDYTFDALEVVCQPIGPVEVHAKALAASALEDIEVATNEITASYDCPDDKPCIAVLTFAYAPGWHAQVDGVDVDVLRADVAFLGIELQGKGRHDIRLTYETPGVRLGGYLTIAGLVLFAALLIFRRVHRRK